MPIFQSLDAEEFEYQGIGINEISESSMLRKKLIPEEDGYARLVQFTVGRNAQVFNLTDKLPKITDDMWNMNEFKNPHFFASSGFVYLNKGRTMESNRDSTLGFKRPITTPKARGLHRSFTEIDF